MKQWRWARGLGAAGLALAVLGLAAACASARDAARTPRAESVAPGVYVVRGLPGDVDTVNLGRVGNAGFIVGEQGVIAIDTGTSYRHGQALLQAIAQVTDRPVRLAIVTHPRQEFLFGAAAFRERGIALHMHRDAARLMASRCETCLKNLQRQLGEDEMRGTIMWQPDVAFDGSPRIDAIGRPVQLLYFGHSSGPGDVAVLDERSGVLFAGGLLDARRIPDVLDGDLAGWRRALDALRARAPSAIVPGHGPVTTVAAIDAEQRYLVRLEWRLTQLLERGVALSEVADAAALPEFDRWDQYDTIHRRNASIIYVRLERDLLFREENRR
ncbi:MBL fold metallo-hydrolase [Caldimonas sp. KR1-144]|uniref:MBL fold metallo-hydrolase n=1 Tax=Caldimonas sp. KR1-144 TaxID=3400911 RepID=UPI003C2E0FAA